MQVLATMATAVLSGAVPALAVPVVRRAPCPRSPEALARAKAVYRESTRAKDIEERKMMLLGTSPGHQFSPESEAALQAWFAKNLYFPFVHDAQEFDALALEVGVCVLRSSSPEFFAHYVRGTR